jgi:hypothetical protein
MTALLVVVTAPKDDCDLSNISQAVFDTTNVSILGSSPRTVVFLKLPFTQFYLR